MTEDQSLLPIGVFDSGLGGISVLAELIRLLPKENFIFLADSANAPYGIKDCETVRQLSVSAARTLKQKGVKALVVACNTATSVAIGNIRDEFEIPVIGMEPALKPAVEAVENGNIIVMATPLTLKEEKFNNLYKRFNNEAPIIPKPCPGLVELIETDAGSGQIIDYLKNLFQDIDVSSVSSVVLGCTHYCFIRKEVEAIFGDDVLVIDGNRGTARHVKALLESKKLLKDDTPTLNYSDVEFMTTGQRDKVIPQCESFLKKYLVSLNHDGE